MKEVITQNLWTFEMGAQESKNVPFFTFISFQQKGRQNSQKLNIDTSYRPPVTSAQSIIGTEKYPVSAMLLNYDDDDYSQGYGQIKEAFRFFTKHDMLQRYKSDNDFRSSNNGKYVGYNLSVFDMHYQKNLESARPIKVEFKNSGNIPAVFYGCALGLTNKLFSISSDGQCHFDFIQVIFTFFITVSFSFFVISVFAGKAPFYLSGKSSMRKHGNVLSIISLVLYNL